MPRTFQRSTTGLTTPPETIFYAPGVSGKAGPFYVALRGVLSAMRTSRASWYLEQAPDKLRAERLRVWRGTVTWVQINPVTGQPLTDGPSGEDVGP